MAIARRRRGTAHPVTTIIIITTTTSDDGRAIFTRPFDQASADGRCALLTNVPTAVDTEAKPPPFQFQEPYRTIS